LLAADPADYYPFQITLSNWKREDRLRCRFTWAYLSDKEAVNTLVDCVAMALEPLRRQCVVMKWDGFAHRCVVRLGGVQADYPAAGKVAQTAEAAVALKPCRHCELGHDKLCYPTEWCKAERRTTRRAYDALESGAGFEKHGYHGVTGLAKIVHNPFVTLMEAPGHSRDKVSRVLAMLFVVTSGLLLVFFPLVLGVSHR
jgi:hypothetical protein